MRIDVYSVSSVEDVNNAVVSDAVRALPHLVVFASRAFSRSIAAKCVT